MRHAGIKETFKKNGITFFDFLQRAGVGTNKVKLQEKKLKNFLWLYFFFLWVHCMYGI